MPPRSPAARRAAVDEFRRRYPHRALPVEVFAPGVGAPRRARAAQVAELKRQLAEQAREVRDLPDSTLRELYKLLVQAQQEAQDGLRRWLKSVPDGQARYTAQEYRRVLLFLGNALDTINAMGPRLTAILGDESRVAGHLATSHLINEVARFSAIFSGTETRIPIQAASVIAAGKSYLIPRFRTSAARYAGNIGDDIRRHLAVGLLRRESIFEMVNRLAREANPTGVVALRGVAGEPGAVVEVIPEGLFTRYRSWGERVVRTEVIGAYAHQQHLALWQGARVVPGIKRRWDATEDGRLCYRCQALDGVVASIGGPFVSSLGESTTDPPLHPNCRCRACAFKDDWADILREAGVELKGDQRRARRAPPAPAK